MDEWTRVVLDDIQELLREGPLESGWVDVDTCRVRIGITGPPGAGKSHLAAAIIAALGPRNAALLPMDGFHLTNAELDRLGRRDRKGAVDTFDVDGYVATLQRAITAYRVADVEVPDFDRERDEPVPAGLIVPATARVVITEGNYLGLASDGWKPVRMMLDRLYYVDCPAPVRYGRLIRRHMAGGRSERDAQAWVRYVDEPNAEVVATTRERCDRVFEVSE